jgi:putative addiction module killer protein
LAIDAFFVTRQPMIEVRQTEAFSAWMAGLRDLQAIARVTARIRRLSLGNFGDVKAVGGGVSEMRIDHGHGYRVYFARRGAVVVLLLCGGDKSTQARDIERAKSMLGEIRDDA